MVYLEYHYLEYHFQVICLPGKSGCVSCRPFNKHLCHVFVAATNIHGANTDAWNYICNIKHSVH